MLTRYVLPIFAVVAGSFAVMQMVKAQQKPPEVQPPIEPARSPFRTSIVGAGLIEPETENISIGTQLPGVVVDVHVKVGQSIEAGTPLFRLDSRHLEAELKVKQANLASAKAALTKLQRMPRLAEIPASDARVQEAQATLKNAEALWDRYRKLESTTAISDDEITRQRWTVEVARAQLARAEAERALLKEGAWEPDVLLAAATVQQAESSIAQTKTELERLIVLAPRPRHGGSEQAREQTRYEVLQLNVRPGEYVGTVSGQPLVVLGCVGQLHVRVDIDENDIARFEPNVPGVARPRGSLAKDYPIRFVRVEPFVIPKKSLTGGNFERVDTRVLQVIYALDNQRDRLFVGQQVDVFLNSDTKISGASTGETSASSRR